MVDLQRAIELAPRLFFGKAKPFFYGNGLELVLFTKKRTEYFLLILDNSP